MECLPSPNRAESRSTYSHLAAFIPSERKKKKASKTFPTARLQTSNFKLLVMGVSLFKPPQQLRKRHWEEEFKSEENWEHSGFLTYSKPITSSFPTKASSCYAEHLLAVSEFRYYSSTSRFTRKLHAVAMDTMLTFVTLGNKELKSQRSFATRASSGCSKTENPDFTLGRSRLFHAEVGTWYLTNYAAEH